MPDTLEVYRAINAVQADLAAIGISKNRVNEQQRYKFRGIDDVYNALSPLLAKHKLVIMPRTLSRSLDERASKSGGVTFYVTVEVEFDFISAVDGSRHVAKTYGEAMDSGDKATNKAMSAAYKYVCFQVFAIPTEGDNDADASSHEVESRQQPQRAAQPAQRGDSAPQNGSGASDKQRWVINKLKTELAMNDDALIEFAHDLGVNLGRASASDASKLITALQARAGGAR